MSWYVASALHNRSVYVSHDTKLGCIDWPILYPWMGGREVSPVSFDHPERIPVKVRTMAAKALRSHGTYAS